MMSRAERSLAEFDAFVDEQVDSARRECVRLDNISRAIHLDKQMSARALRWAETYQRGYLEQMKARFFGGQKDLPNGTIPLVARSNVDSSEFYKSLISNKDVLFAVYAHVEYCNHFP